MQQSQKHLLQLVYAKQNSELQEIKKKLTEYSKYFFNIRRNITIVYDKSTLYIIHKDYLKLIDLGKIYLITDLVYNYEKNIVIFLTTEGQLYAHFAATKTQILIKKDFKKIFLMECIYSAQQTAHLFIAEEGGIHLYRIEEEKKSIKEVKHLSGKYHCFLYEPFGELLVGLQYGDCELAYLFHFEPQKAKSWFRSGEIDVSFTNDQAMAKRIKLKKCLGLQGSRIGKEIFSNKKYLPEDYFIDIQRINNTPYMFFYYSNEGKLQLTPLVESLDKKEVTIKLPSDSLPSFNIVDNMLVVHLKNQKITFIYDVNPTSFQALVSPYPLTHEQSELSSQAYSSEFISKRALLPSGQISKWRISLPVIYHYLKNEMQVFEFLNRRMSSKMETIKWMRENLFTFKQINLSKMWKSIFVKIESCLYDESQIVSIIEIYSNLFYTLSIEPLNDKATLINILIECLRQANQYRIIIPDQFQILVVEMLLATEKYDLLAYLCHHDVINSAQKVFKMIYERGIKEKNDLLVTLSIDLAYQAIPSKQVLRMIMKSQRVKEGKRFIKNNFDKMEALDLLEVAQYISNLELKKQFIGYIRSFITNKYPSINPIYLDEAQSKLFQ